MIHCSCRLQNDDQILDCFDACIRMTGRVIHWTTLLRSNGPSNTATQISARPGEAKSQRSWRNEAKHRALTDAGVVVAHVKLPGVAGALKGADRVAAIALGALAHGRVGGALVDVCGMIDQMLATGFDSQLAT